MEKQTRYFASDAGGTDNPGAMDSGISGSQGMGDTDEGTGISDEHGEGSTTGDGAAGNDESTLTGTDRDETGPGENMATES